MSSGSPATFTSQGFPIIASILDVFMAGATDSQRFAVPGGHAPFPLGQLRTILRVQVGELFDVVDFDLLIRATQLTFLSQKAFDDFAASTPDGFRRLIVDADPLIRSQREATKVSHQRFLGWLVRIPVIPATQSSAKLPPNPVQSCHPIQCKAATQSGTKLPPTIGAQRRRVVYGSPAVMFLVKSCVHCPSLLV
jgi:hypothetical protein